MTQGPGSKRCSVARASTTMGAAASARFTEPSTRTPASPDSSRARWIARSSAPAGPRRVVSSTSIANGWEAVALAVRACGALPLRAAGRAAGAAPGISMRPVSFDVRASWVTPASPADPRGPEAARAGAEAAVLGEAGSSPRTVSGPDRFMTGARASSRAGRSWSRTAWTPNRPWLNSPLPVIWPAGWASEPSRASKRRMVAICGASGRACTSSSSERSGSRRASQAPAAALPIWSWTRAGLSSPCDSTFALPLSAVLGAALLNSARSSPLVVALRSASGQAWNGCRTALTFNSCLPEALAPAASDGRTSGPVSASDAAQSFSAGGSADAVPDAAVAPARQSRCRQMVTVRA